MPKTSGCVRSMVSFKMSGLNYKSFLVHGWLSKWLYKRQERQKMYSVTFRPFTSLEIFVITLYYDQPVQEAATHYLSRGGGGGWGARTPIWLCIILMIPTHPTHRQSIFCSPLSTLSVTTDIPPFFRKTMWSFKILLAPSPPPRKKNGVPNRQLLAFCLMIYLIALFIILQCAIRPTACWLHYRAFRSFTILSS